MGGLTKDDIIRMAREVADKDKVDPVHNDMVTLTVDELGRLLAAEREACAKVCEQRAADHEEDSRFENDPDYKKRFLVYAKYERRCAKEIRARGNDAA